MFTKNEILEALSEQYYYALRNLNEDEEGLPFDEADAVAASIERIAEKLGLLKELQGNA